MNGVESNDDDANEHERIRNEMMDGRVQEMNGYRCT
jgi:hypothetical protein